MSAYHFQPHVNKSKKQEPGPATKGQPKGQPEGQGATYGNDQPTYDDQPSYCDDGQLKVPQCNMTSVSLPSPLYCRSFPERQMQANHRNRTRGKYTSRGEQRWARLRGARFQLPLCIV